MNSLARTSGIDLIIVTVALSQAGSPFAGTWKLNLAKSKFDPGPAPRSSMIKIDAIEGGERVVTDRVDARGKASHTEFAPVLDGKERAAPNDPNVDTIVNHMITDHSFLTIRKKGGQVRMINLTVVSADGKVRTITTVGTDARGGNVNDVAVYDRQ